MDQQCQDFAAALEAERRKILVFQKELPLSLKLVTETIEACRKQLAAADEATSEGGGPVLEEFISLNPSLSWTEEEQTVAEEEEEEERSDWLRSVQLWNQQPEPEPEPPKKLGGAFHPFEKVKLAPEDRDDVQESSSTSETTTFTRGERQKETQSRRKPRRCWSPELHRRFLNALQQLGGSNAATPKQIRELINVDGLTNDEVKSHLQKYRLHTKRPGLQNSSMHQGTQFVIVDGIWVPPAEYAAIVAAAAAAAQPTDGASCDPTRNAIYAPKASLPPGCTSHKNKNLSHSLANPLGIEGRCGEDVNGVVEVNTTSPASASSDTVIASPPL